MPAPEPESLKVVGQVGGPTQAVAVQGKYAYVGVGLRLVVLDVSNPASPREVGATQPFEWYVEDVVVSGDTAYVAAGEGLYILDISDPAHPKVVGVHKTSGFLEGVAVSGRYAYMADGPAGLRIVDIGNPTRPVEVGSAYSLHYVFDVAVEGKHAYLAASDAGLLVTDISDPTKPREIGSLDTPGYAYGVTVSGTTAYVADGWGGLHVVNVSTPTQPRESGFYDTLGWAFDVAMKDGVAYVADGWGGVRLLDVRDPTKLAELGSYSPAGGLAMGLAVDGKALYLADRTAGLRVLDVQNTARPTQVSLYAPIGFADDVAVAGDYAYVAAGPYGLRVIDVSDVAHPKEVGAYDTLGYAWSIAVEGKYAYVSSLPTAVHRSRLHVVDISNPAKPTPVANVEEPPDRPRNMVIERGILYGANEWGLMLVDVSNPRAPAQLGFLQLSGPTSQGATVDVAVSGNMAYVAQESDGLKIVDVYNPRAPAQVAAYNSPDMSKVNAVAVVGDIAFLGDASGRLHVVDIHDPKNPKGMGFIRVSGGIEDIALVDNTLYLASGAPGLQVVDISNRQMPVLSESRYVPGYVPGLAVSGNYVYVAAEEGGMFILGRVEGTDAPTANAFGRSTHSGQTATLLSFRGVSYQAALDGAASSSALLTDNEAKLADSPPVERGSTAGPIDSSSDTARSLASPSVLAVTSDADSGPGTLRWALENARSGDTITFNPVAFPPTNPSTISLSSSLRPLTQGGLTIDASDAGVILDGASITTGASGLTIFSDGNGVRGLQIINFSGPGLHISNAKDNTIGGSRTRGSGPLGEGNLLSSNGNGVDIFGPAATGNKLIGNYIGTDITGMSAMGNRYNGVFLTGGALHNFIGGTTPDERNIISGNRWGGVTLLDVGTSGNRIIGNYIGLDASGARTLGQVDSGIFIGHGASRNIIGGTAPGERNVVSGNGREEIGLMTGANGNIIVGNYIGTDATGALNLGNATMAGVTMELGPYNNVIQGNVISANVHTGVMISDWGTWGNEVIGNLIGGDATGTVSLGGSGSGIQANAPFNKIGGTTAAERNVISGNGRSGIKIGFHGMGDVIVVGNFIGTDASGTKVIGNGSHGIVFSEGAYHTFIGGATRGARNVISGNRGGGIQLDGVGVRYNFIMGNYVGTDASGTAGLPNQYGIGISGAEHNFVQANLVAYNEKGGISIKPGGGNRIHHNSMVNNGSNGSDDGSNSRWDDGRTGNYWSDYQGKDANGDGVGDTPYPVPPNGVDRYPLMKPFEAELIEMGLSRMLPSIWKGLTYMGLYFLCTMAN